MGLREGKKKKVRQSIQTAAVELFRERGFGGTRVREIIERVQISESTFFNYYATKDAVLNEWAHEKIATALCRNMNGTYLGLQDEITERARHLAAEISEDRVFLMTVWKRVRATAPVQESSGSLRELSEFIVARQSRGEVKEGVPARQLASLITGVVMSTISDWLIDPDRQTENLEIRMARAIEWLFDGCGTEPIAKSDRAGADRWAQLGTR